MLDREIALVEAILFLEVDPIGVKDIVKISSLPKNAVIEILSGLKDKYLSDNSRGIELTEIDGTFQLSAKSDLWDFLKERYGKKNEKKLSRAAIETLSIIAYSQPITRSEIENIRGVKAEGMIKLLLTRGFVSIVGKKDIPGKPVQYGTTKEFLKSFRLKSIAELPKLSELDENRFELNG